MSAAASEFWRRVADGTLILSRVEDEMLWRMRAAGEAFETIAGVICARRRRRRL